ncbi:MAG: ATP-dependent endonuclease [Actinomycetota bacterium]
MLSKILVQNYRCFKNFELEFNEHLNIFVGDNEAGKSTLLEAVHLALTFRLNGKPFTQELSPYLINLEARDAYVAALRSGGKPVPPEVIIDLFMVDSQEVATLRGANNLAQEDSVGVRVRASFDSEFSEEYEEFTSDPSKVLLVPTEYYKIEWLGFSGNWITGRSVPASASFIDASTIRLHSGADQYLQDIISQQLDRRERVELSRNYRSVREAFSDNESVKAINEKLSDAKGDISDRTLSLSIDISHRFTWESSLAPHLDELPFQYVGSGEQNSLKILLALNRKADEAHVVLIEEPENHLSFSSLNVLISKISEKCADKQVLLSTHSSYVLNKLGLDNLVLLSRDTVVRITNLPASTEEYFKKLSGYDTLRLVLAKKVILVEGPSDELVVQRAYKDRHGKLPIEDGVDVINVRGLSAKRFLDISVLLGRRTAVVTDNDGKDPDDVRAAFANYTDRAFVTVHVGDDPDLKTLEPQLFASNSLAVLNQLFETNFSAPEELLNYMANNKTTCALAILETDESISMPGYIADAVDI